MKASILIATSVAVGFFLASVFWALKGQSTAVPSAEYAELVQQISRLQEQIDQIVEIGSPTGPLNDSRSTAATDSAGQAVAARSVQEQVGDAPAWVNSVRGGNSVRGVRRDSVVERLTAAGFPPWQAESVDGRADALMMALIEARYVAERSGTPLSEEQIADLEPSSILRTELGDADYERYLRALGQYPAVRVVSIIQNSPAAKAGLLVEDRILSYGATRVFDPRDLASLTLEGRQGEPVVLDVLRGGVRVQVVVPRGPLGVSLSSAREAEGELTSSR